MSIELVCDGCGKRLRQSSSGMIPLTAQEWAEIEVRPPRKVQARERISELVAVMAPRYTVCSVECAQKILAKVGRELEYAFKTIATTAQDKKV